MFNNALEAVQTACRKELGKEFQFEFDDRINPVLMKTASLRLSKASLVYSDIAGVSYRGMGV